MTGPGAVPRDRLGVGWTFPPAPDVVTTAVEWRSGPALVRQSIHLILDTEPGERVMRPTFGCGLRRFVMEPNTPATRAGLAREVEAALRAWEPRIDLRAVRVTETDEPTVVLVSINYVHVSDQTTASFAVPFALAGAGGGT